MNQEEREDQPAKILDAVRNGDSRAFDDLLSRYQPLLGASVIPFTDSYGNREEALQEARYALYRAAVSYRRGCGVTFGLYAKVCVRNALISGVRRRKSGQATCSLDALCESGHYPAEERTPTDVILDRLIDSETAEELCRQIATVLSPYERKVFEMHADHRPVSEIAACLSKSTKSVGNAVTRSVAKLRRLLGENPLE